MIKTFLGWETMIRASEYDVSIEKCPMKCNGNLSKSVIITIGSVAVIVSVNFKLIKI